MPAPLVRVRNWLRKPIRPRAGMLYSRRTRPLPSGTMLVRSPLRRPISSMTLPWDSSGMSMVTFSNGSCFTPLTSRMITSGRPTAISKPSRRMVSIRTDRCSSPRPETLNLSAESPSSTRSATLYSSSLSRRSLMLRLVTNLPSLPQNGESLTWKVIETVGSSTVSGFIASTLFMSHRVSEMNSSSKPLMQTMSPAWASSTSTRCRPWWPISLRIRPLRFLPLVSMATTGVFGLTRPRAIRPTPITPRKLL
ncbi:hypothetical protein D3C76_895140 [compost metagenome]